MKTNSIKSWSLEDRPREKLIDKGSRELSDAELLAILIGTGTKKLSAVDLTKIILGHFNYSLLKLGKCQVDELLQFPGVGHAKAVTIVAAMELARRRSKEIPEKKQKITCPKDAFSLLQPNIQDILHEEFYVIYLNRANEVLKTVRISSGGMTGTVVDAKMIFKEALLNNSSGIILAHNHPSGQLRPSEADKKITKSIKEFGQLVDLPILDHLILCDNGYFSFADEGLL